jgi:hypothetical protein
VISCRTYRVAGDCEGREYLCVLSAGQHMRSKYELSIINDERNAIFWTDANSSASIVDDMGGRVRRGIAWHPGSIAQLLSRFRTGHCDCRSPARQFRSSRWLRRSANWAGGRLLSNTGYSAYVLRANWTDAPFSIQMSGNSWSCLERGLTGYLGEGAFPSDLRQSDLESLPSLQAQAGFLVEAGLPGRLKPSPDVVRTLPSPKLILNDLLGPRWVC